MPIISKEGYTEVPRTESDPHWANWTAKDSFGHEYYYAFKPHKEGCLWLCAGKYQYKGDGLSINWEQSLRRIV